MFTDWREETPNDEAKKFNPVVFAIVVGVMSVMGIIAFIDSRRQQQQFVAAPQPNPAPTSEPDPAQPRPTGEHPVASNPSNRIKPKFAADSLPMTASGHEFVTSMLWEMDSFRSNPKFHQFGFGGGAPYGRWLRELQDRRKLVDANEPNNPTEEGLALGYLLNLGTEYMHTKGEENKFTGYAREEIKKSLATYKPPAKTPSEPLVSLAPDPRMVDHSLPPPGRQPTDWKRLGSIETRVVAAQVGPAPLRDRAGNEFHTAEPVLRIWVETRAVAPPKNELRRWASTLDPARLSGPPGKPIAKSKAATGAVVRGELVGGKKLVPGGDAVADVLLFDIPPAAADALVLTLEGEHVGESGLMRHVIPADLWKS